MVARFFLCVAVALVPFQPADSSDRTLKDIGPIAIAIEPLAPAAARLGLTADALRDDAARTLAAAKVPVGAERAGPRLTVSINAVPIETTRRSASGVSYSVTVTIDEDVTIVQTGENARAATWRRAGIGVASAGRAKDAILGQLKEYLDAFVAAWRKANGGEAGQERREGPERREGATARPVFPALPASPAYPLAISSYRIADEMMPPWKLATSSFSFGA
jgi:hypothetical protein